ncbi:MAG: Peptide chain release factor 2 [Parcubacteria group bacterium GW2011_GWB1_49_12]|nr:MAG: Peptide chain release factor 2 [Parcubacteria group bacterium GW2011_GWB1_49_12]
MGISAGAGGQDAQDWAAMLQRMYERYCEKKGWRVEAIHRSFGEPGAEGRIGVKQASFQASGPFAYGLLKRETGVHRLVRMSPFSAKQLRHTSFAAVEVTPEVDVKQEKDIEIKPEDVRVEFFNASGPGGQNVNKRETAVRLVHEPTGIVVTSQASRSQQQNREKAMQVLASKLYSMREQEQEKEFADMRGKQAAIEWGSQIRSYVLHPYKLVKDVRTNVETADVESVLDGDLDIFIEARQ